MDKSLVYKKNTVFRLFVIFLASFLLFIYVFPWKNYDIVMPFSGRDYKLGLDLQGGIELDYKVDLEEVRKEEGEKFTREREKEIIENLKKIIDKRIESLRINDSEINDASYGTEKHIIVQIPLKGTNSEENTKNIDAAKKAIGNVVKVSFKELRQTDITEKDLEKRKEIAKNLLNELKDGEDISILKNKYSLNYELVEVGTILNSGTEYLTIDEKNSLDKIFFQNNFLKGTDFYNTLEDIINSGLNKNRADLLKKVQEESVKISEKRKEVFKNNENFSIEETNLLVGITDILSNNLNSEVKKILKENNNKEIELNEININSVDYYLIFKNNSENNIDYILINKRPSQWVDIVSSDGKVLNDKYLLKASVSSSQVGESVIVLNFNDEGGRIFYEATSRLIGRPIAIFVGGELVTSPNVNQAIAGGQATISGNYNPRTAQKSADDINAGLVPAPIYLTSEKTIDSKIGAEALDKLVIAGGAGFLLMLIFLAFIYKAAGLMAFLALVIYTIIVLAIIKGLGVVLTLASIAGLILSVGMAIDANILIFERIKGELKEGKDLHTALDIGFKDSWSAIWDSNITGLLVAIILFIFGINLIKGFGIMLGIGIVVSLFTAMYVSRVFVIFLANNIKDRNLFIGLKNKTNKK